IDFLYHRARPFLFSTSHPPSVAATCIAAFDVLEQEPERIEKLWENTRFWKKELGLLGFDIGGRNTPPSETPITPIIIGDGKLTMDFSRELFKEGVMGTGIAFPTVPEGLARIRTIMTAKHTHDQLQQALEVLKRVGKRMGILGYLSIASVHDLPAHNGRHYFPRQLPPIKRRIPRLGMRFRNVEFPPLLGIEYRHIRIAATGQRTAPVQADNPGRPRRKQLDNPGQWNFLLAMQAGDRQP